MDTLQTHLFDQKQTTKRVFRQLFLLQIQLEKYVDSSFDEHEEVVEMIEAIDQLMIELIDCYHPEKD